MLTKYHLENPEGSIVFVNENSSNFKKDDEGKCYMTVTTGNDLHIFPLTEEEKKTTDSLKRMEVCGISDLHGKLIDLLPCDVVCICGDIVPLNIQRNSILSKEWFCTKFFDWVRDLKCSKVIFIGGNHDFWLQEAGYREIIRLITENGLSDKLTYLEDNSISYNGLTFYGCPWVTGPYGWAFFDQNVEDKYDKIENCDVLLTHQPPNVNKIGYSYPNKPYEKNFGSNRLLTSISRKDIRYNLCGHIHSGIHKKTTLDSEGVNTIFYNVSILDEEYLKAYNPLYLQIDIKNELQGNL